MGVRMLHQNLKGVLSTKKFHNTCFRETLVLEVAGFL